MALQEQLAKYDAFVSSVEMNNYGYWQVTFSVAPGLSLSLTCCQTGIDREQAVDSVTGTLRMVTGQTVRPR
jgi:hypothetical protein